MEAALVVYPAEVARTDRSVFRQYRPSGHGIFVVAGHDSFRTQADFAYLAVRQRACTPRISSTFGARFADRYLDVRSRPPDGLFGIFGRVVGCRSCSYSRFGACVADDHGDSEALSSLSNERRSRRAAAESDQPDARDVGRVETRRGGASGDLSRDSAECRYPITVDHLQRFSSRPPFHQERRSASPERLRQLGHRSDVSHRS